MIATHNRERLMLAIFSALCVLIFLFRVYFTQLHTFMFLNWNLLLAAIPYLLTSSFVQNKEVKPLVFIPVLLCWLLFFPNAPYILTDLFHLKPRAASPIWLDLVLILAYAWTGLLFGFYSLRHLQAVLIQYRPALQVSLLIATLLFISSFGIYLGRYLRWNSWDMITHPQELAGALWHRFAFPLQHRQTWGMTFFLGIVLNMMYWSLTMPGIYHKPATKA